MQLSSLTEIARKNNLPVLLTNQVYQDFENKEKVNIVGGDLLKYQSKCLIELKKTDVGVRRAIIRKHRSIEEDKEILFRIINLGIEEVRTDDDEESNTL
jgi:DNA repair protein RadB